MHVMRMRKYIMNSLAIIRKWTPRLLELQFSSPCSFVRFRYRPSTTQQLKVALNNAEASSISIVGACRMRVTRLHSPTLSLPRAKKTSCVGAVQYMRSYESCFSPLHCLGGRSWSGDDGWLWAAHAATQKRSATTPSLDVMWPAGKVPYVFDDRVGTFTFRRLG